MLVCEIARVRRVALVGWTRSTKQSLDWGDGIEVVLIRAFLQRIVDALKGHDPARHTVPEGYPLLRSMQAVVGYCKYGTDGACQQRHRCGEGRP